MVFEDLNGSEAEESALHESISLVSGDFLDAELQLKALKYFQYDFFYIIVAFLLLRFDDDGTYELNKSQILQIVTSRLPTTDRGIEDSFLGSSLQKALQILIKLIHFLIFA